MNKRLIDSLRGIAYLLFAIILLLISLLFLAANGFLAGVIGLVALGIGVWGLLLATPSLPPSQEEENER